MSTQTDTKGGARLIDGDLTETIRARIPGYSQAVAALDAATRLPLPTASAPTVLGQAAATVEERLLDGNAPDTAELLDIAATAEIEVNAVATARAAVTSVRERLKARTRDLLDQHAHTTVLAGLQEALSEVVAELQALAPLNQIIDDATAVASDRAADRQRLQALAGVYRTIRTEQRRIMKAFTGEDDLPVPEVAVIRNLTEVFALAVPWRTHGFLIEDGGQATRSITPPWPHRDDDLAGRERAHATTSRHTFWTDASGSEFLLWALEAGAELWVPTGEEFNAASEKHHRLTRHQARSANVLRTEDGRTWTDPGAVNLRDTTSYESRTHPTPVA